jgi:hypothetical protein
VRTIAAENITGRPFTVRHLVNQNNYSRPGRK